MRFKVMVKVICWLTHSEPQFTDLNKDICKSPHTLHAHYYDPMRKDSINNRLRTLGTSLEPYFFGVKWGLPRSFQLKAFQWKLVSVFIPSLPLRTFFESSKNLPIITYSAKTVFEMVFESFSKTSKKLLKSFLTGIQDVFKMYHGEPSKKVQCKTYLDISDNV